MNEKKCLHGILMTETCTDQGCNGTTGRLEKQEPCRCEELKDFVIWMTGCGYDFCQHSYFIEQRDKLLH